MNLDTFTTLTTGQRDRIPAEAFMATGVTPTARSRGMTRPWAPSATAERAMAPRWWGSSTPSRTTSKGGSPATLAASRTSWSSA